jgi:hypothetical protein
MPDLDFAGVRDGVRAAVELDYADVRRRASRRRRNMRFAAAVAMVMALAVGWAVLANPAGIRRMPTGPHPTPTSVAPPAPLLTPPPMGSVIGEMAAGDVNHLFLSYRDCASGRCVARLAATTDRGRTWRSLALPVAVGPSIELWAVSPRTLVLCSPAPRQAGEPTWQASVDGGVSWRRLTVSAMPGLPAGWRPIGWDNDRLWGADPVTGDVAEVLATHQLRMWRLVESLPTTAGIWVSGFRDDLTDSSGRVVGKGAAVAVSRDGGRTWLERALPEDLVSTDGPGSAAIATADGRTVYAVGRVGAALRIYRSDDGGASWRRTTAARTVEPVPMSAAVGPGGNLFVQSFTAQDGAVLLLRSSDRGVSVHQASIGPGAAAVPVPGGFVQAVGQPIGTGAWVHPDGSNWEYVALATP